MYAPFFSVTFIHTKVSHLHAYRRGSVFVLPMRLQRLALSGVPTFATTTPVLNLFFFEQLRFHTINRQYTGTYNNQYMVIDLKVFQAGQQLQPGLLTIVEQIPGLVLFDDLTETLERGYWPR